MFAVLRVAVLAAAVTLAVTVLAWLAAPHAGHRRRVAADGLPTRPAASAPATRAPAGLSFTNGAAFSLTTVTWAVPAKLDVLAMRT